ncbi:putative phage abortive infection protein [Methylovorus mays]|uniref:putative phage abortive infection protein n=1 Tax=Methylovorus mays TaxID=184077 RepID=UPI001E610E53|nr:putative phage abortive infection protein [Methylovorus mays]MCB5206539.1 putative phage abortive infection protein [Methylovorus mays]
MSTDLTATWGQFGDYMGGTLNPILSFFAFVFLVRTLALQQQSIQIQKDELSLTREEMKKTTRALEIQNIEGVFFQLLKRNTELLNNIAFSTSTNGNGVQTLYLVLHPLINLEARDNESVIKGFLNSIKTIKVSAGPYLSNLYLIIDMIDKNNELDFVDKNKYIDIVKSQLTSWEVAFLFYYGQCEEGFHFAYFINKYGLFKNYDPSLINNKLTEYDHYDAFAFK